jgi:hypothetical protein
MKRNLRRIACVFVILLFLAVAAFGIQAGRLHSYMSRGHSALMADDFDLALVEYTKAAQMTPRSPQPYAGRACAWLGKKNYEQAIQDRLEKLSCKLRAKSF